MTNRKRTNPVQFYLDDDEQYILDEIGYLWLKIF